MSKLKIAVISGLVFVSVFIGYFNDLKASGKEEPTDKAVTPAVTADPEIMNKKVGYVNAGPDVWYQVVNNTFVALSEHLGLGWEITALNSEYSPEKEFANVQDLITKGVDAIAIVTANVENAAQTAKIANDADVPIFFIVGKPKDTSGGGTPDGYVGDDWIGMGYNVGEYVAKNHPNSKVVTLDGQYGHGVTEFIFEGFQMALDDYNTGIVAESIGTGNWARDKAIAVTEDLLASGKDFDVIYVMNEEMCAGTLQVFAENGITDKIVLSDNGKEMAWEWIREGKIAATSPNPPTLNGDLSFQQMLRYFKGEPYETYLTIYYDILSKENLDEAIPWILEDYLEGRDANQFPWELSHYEQQLKEKQQN